MELKSKYKLFKTVLVVDYPSYTVVEGCIVDIYMTYFTQGMSAYGKPEQAVVYYVKYKDGKKTVVLPFDEDQCFIGKRKAENYAQRQNKGHQPTTSRKWPTKADIS